MFGKFTNRDEYRDVYTLVMGDTIRFAKEMEYDDPSWDDWCSGVAVISTEAMEITGDDVTIDPNHAEDVNNLKVAQRILDSYESQTDDWVITRELWEVAELIAKRTGVTVLGLDVGHYMASVTKDLTHAEYILVGRNAENHAKEYAAQINGARWSIYDVPKARVDQWISDDWGTIENFDFVSESTDDCHGYVWENIDSEGFSTPTEKELSYAL